MSLILFIPLTRVSIGNISIWVFQFNYLNFYNNYTLFKASKNNLFDIKFVSAKLIIIDELRIYYSCLICSKGFVLLLLFHYFKKKLNCFKVCSGGVFTKSLFSHWKQFWTGKCGEGHPKAFNSTTQVHNSYLKHRIIDSFPLMIKWKIIRLKTV